MAKDKEKTAPSEKVAVEPKEKALEEKKDTPQTKESAMQKPEVKKGETHIVIVSSLTSKRGILLQDQGCQARDFVGGPEQLEKMVAQKLIKKV